MEELRRQGQKKSLLVFIVCDLLSLPPLAGFIVKSQTRAEKTLKYITVEEVLTSPESDVALSSYCLHS